LLVVFHIIFGAHACAPFLIGNTILFQSFYKQAYEIVLDALISGPIYHDLIWFLMGHDASSFYVIEMHILHNTSSHVQTKLSY